MNKNEWLWSNGRVKVQRVSRYVKIIIRMKGPRIRCIQVQVNNKSKKEIISTSLHRQMQSIRCVLVSFGLAPAASMNHLHAKLYNNN